MTMLRWLDLRFDIKVQVQEPVPFGAKLTTALFTLKVRDSWIHKTV